MPIEVPINQVSTPSQVAALNTSMIQKGIDVSDLRIDMPLTVTSQAYVPEMSEYVAQDWFRILPTDELSGVYWTYDLDTFYRNKRQAWVPGSRMAQGEWNVSHTGTYKCAFSAYEQPVAGHLQAAANQIIQVEADAQQIVMQTMLQGREEDIFTKYFQNSAGGGSNVWGSNYSGTTSGPSSSQFVYFDDQINSNPRPLFKKIKMAVKKATGKTPNTLLLSEPVYEALRIHPSIVEMYRPTSVPDLDEAQVAKILGFPKILVSRAMKVTSNDSETIVLDWVAGTGAWCGYVHPTIGPKTPTAGAIFSYTKLFGGWDTAMVRVPDLRVHSDFFQGIQCYDSGIMGTGLGAMLTGCISSTSA